MGEYKKYWIAVVAENLIIGFSILGYLGTECIIKHRQYLDCVCILSMDKSLFTKEDIFTWSIGMAITGGQSVGTVLGHGAYQAPDWTADCCIKKCL